MNIKTLNGIVLISIVLLTSCGEDDEKLVCSTSSVTLFDKAFTRFTLSRNTDGTALLDLIKVYDGTDSSYTYSYTYASGVLTNVIRAEDGVTLNYAVTTDGTKVSKLTSKTVDGKNKDEIRFIYSNEQVTQTQVRQANEAGTFFQIGHNAYTYDSKGNLTKRETFLDIAALFTIAFGSDPSGYSPLLFDQVQYEPGDVSNPLKGYFYIDNLDLALMNNVPQKISATGASSESYSITKDGSGLFTKATSGDKYLEATYVCQ